MKNIIVSIEWSFTSLELHIIVSDLGRVYTYKVDSIRNQKIINSIVQNLLNNNPEKIIDLIKDRYSLLHCGITLSLGPTLRRKLKERKEF